jgi:hypothetical protein
MNPIWLWMLTLTTVLSRLRRCPRCHHRQLVPRDKLAETVACKRCGADLPARSR